MRTLSSALLAALTPLTTRPTLSERSPPTARGACGRCNSRSSQRDTSEHIGPNTLGQPSSRPCRSTKL
eukprot:2238086-Lingulodinium_polyedra.AAC.1